MRRILVTGAAGFIGSHLAHALSVRGERVFGIDDFNDSYDPNIKRENLSNVIDSGTDFTLLEGDICEESFLMKAFESARPEVVVHLAARAGVRPSLLNPILYHRVNVIGTQRILDFCVNRNLSHLVLASSSSVYGGMKEFPFKEEMAADRPISPYAATKRMNELMAHVYSSVYGLNITLLRFFTVYGPRQRPDMAINKFARLIENGKPVTMYGDGSSQRDYTYVGDIVDGIIQAVDRPFRYEIFNLGEQQTIRLCTLIDLIAKTLGKEALVDYQPMQAGDVEITCADIQKARKLLGYNPRFSIEQGIARYVEWLRTSNPVRGL